MPTLKATSKTKKSINFQLCSGCLVRIDLVTMTVEEGMAYMQGFFNRNLGFLDVVISGDLVSSVITSSDTLGVYVTGRTSFGGVIPIASVGELTDVDDAFHTYMVALVKEHTTGNSDEEVAILVRFIAAQIINRARSRTTDYCGLIGNEIEAFRRTYVKLTK